MRIGESRKTVTLAFKVDPATKEHLKFLAYETRWSQSEVVRQLIERTEPSALLTKTSDLGMVAAARMQAGKMDPEEKRRQARSLIAAANDLLRDAE